MLLGTAILGHRRAMVTPLPTAPGHLVDLNRMEAVRLRKLGEGQPDAMADVLVPSSLRRVLESGPRALARIRQTLDYAMKWWKKGNLPEELAPRLEQVRLLPCLPRPASIQHQDGRFCDRLKVFGPNSEIPWTEDFPLIPALGLVGMHGAKELGFCLVLNWGDSLALGPWLRTRFSPSDCLEIQCENFRQEHPFGEDLRVPDSLIRTGELLFRPIGPDLPVEKLRPGASLHLRAPGEAFELHLGLRPGTWSVQ